MKTWFGSYYASAHAEPVEATALVSEKGISIGFRSADQKAETIHWAVKEVEAVYVASLQASSISCVRNTSRLLIEGQEASKFIQDLQVEQNKAWYRKDRTREWTRNLLVFSLVIGLLLSAYFWLLPFLSEKMATRVSVEREEQFGNTIYNSISMAWQEDTVSTELLNKFFQEMNIPSVYRVRITVVEDDIVNAFALPGGHIVVYSALLKQLKSYPELAALLSHEFTHISHKHSTRSVFRQLGSKMFFALLLGRQGAVSAILAGQAAELKSLQYSRGLEKEADLNGLSLLRDRSIDPEGFAGLFQQLKNAGGSGNPELLASHPDINSRIEYIRQAAVGATKSENPRLLAIFNQLKSSSNDHYNHEHY